MTNRKWQLKEQLEKVLEFLQFHVDEKGFPPSLAEIADHFGCNSKNSAKLWIEHLESQGRIKVTPGIARGIKIVSCEATHCTHVQTDCVEPP
jgi:repressor LexA